ncbi:family 16 glycosylhydrolase [Sphingopyxis alaskensis]|uniref:glycoside hydrolase family 16 protein n=1 Tax=Sphingopyxis alaskensis TaxID=117207 RepID=UPI00391BB2CF
MTPAFVIALVLEGMHTPAAVPEQDNWTLVWSDEFDGETLDRTKWSFDVDCWGGGNDERQCYTDSARNAQLEQGRLVITAREETVKGAALPARMRAESSSPTAEVTREYSSARLTTRGKASWTYGKIEVSARLPQGQGTWPAIWMLPEEDRYGSWAASGEIDILEAVNLGVACQKCPGGRENRILGTLHFGGAWPNNQHKGEEMAFSEVLDGAFHTYTLIWYPERMIWQVDGRTFAERSADEWSTSASSAPAAPFDQPFHLILNLAIGGRLAESRGLGGVQRGGYPKRMEVDWVRVWQKGGPGISPAIDQAAERGE